MSAFGHIINLIITLFFWPWIIVWVGCAVSAGNSRKHRDDKKRDEELQLLRKIANRGEK